MVDAFRSMLDELMGKERDVPLAKRQNKALEFDSPDVCKYELVALCPNRLFRNTRSDLGNCGFSIHDDHLEWPKLKEHWDKLPQKEKDRYPFEHELIRYMDQLIRDMDAKIRQNKQRAEAESRPKPIKPDDQRRLDELKARQAEMVARAAQLGEAGDVDGALEATQAAEAVGRQHDALFKQLSEPERSMTVCEVCGVFINAVDDQRRLTPGELKAREDHLTGKQYLGWKRIRETYTELVAARAARSPPRARSGSREAERGRERGSSRDYDRGSSRDRDRDHSRGDRRSDSYDARGRDREYRDRDFRDHHRGDRGHHHYEHGRDYRRGGSGGDYHDHRRGGGGGHGRSRSRSRSPRGGRASYDRRYNEAPPPGQLYGRGDDYRRY